MSSPVIHRARPQRRHSLRRNDRTWTPHHVGFFDTEFPRTNIGPGGGQAFLCGVGMSQFRHGKGRKTVPSSEVGARTREELADWVEEQCKGGVPLWLYAHNLGVDLQASDLIGILTRRGWELGKQGLANPHPWAYMKRNSWGLWLQDSFSLYGCSEAELGELIGLAKFKMPDWDEGIEVWLPYCRRDVEIGLAALLTTMDEWDWRRQGNWTHTGPGCAWNALRHTIETRTVWIDPDDDARRWERGAVYAGRRELFRRGTLPEPEYVDLDLEHAHAAVAASFPLPTGRGIRFGSLDLDSKWLLRDSVGVIARARLSCERSRYPLREKGGILHPIGEFWTTLCGPELEEARQRGELREIGPGIAYQLSLWAQDWSQWVCGVLDSPPREMAAVYQRMVKGWSKSVWGRCALRTAGTTEIRDGPGEELRIIRGWTDQGDRTVILQLDWREETTIMDREGDDSFPAILAWIQSWVRVMVSRLVDELGEGEVVPQVATDGVLVAPWRLAQLVSEHGVQIAAPGGIRELAEAACLLLSLRTAPLRVRLKDVLRQVTVHGPDHLEAEGVTKLAGVPRSAKRRADGAYVGEVWPSFAVATHRSVAGEVRLQPRIWHLDKVRPARWAYQDGCCEAVRAEVGGEGVSRLLGPSGAACAAHGAPLEEVQHPALARILRQRGVEVRAAERPVGAAGAAERRVALSRLRPQ